MKNSHKMNWPETTVVITGATGGLGQALVMQLNQLGAQLVLHGRDEARLQQMVDELDRDAGCVYGDLSQSEVLTKIRDEATQSNCTYRMLINNAAMNAPGFLNQQDEQVLTQTIAVNLTVPIVLSRHLLSWLCGGERGHIVNIGSSFGGIGYPGFSSYCASKFGLLGFSQALQRELSGQNVDVYYLAPRAMDTTINTNEVKAMNKILKNTEDQPKTMAKVIIRSIERKHHQRFFGWPEKLFVKLNSMFPKLVSQSINRDLPVIHQHLNQEQSHEA